MTEQKQPQAGEYWQKEYTRVCVIGTKKNRLTVGETECGTLIPFLPIHDWQHLPDCDSFDWQPEVWPKWYVHCDADWDWCVEQYKVDRIRVHRVTGVEDHPWVAMYSTNIADGTWIKVTEAEALARVTPAEVWPKWYVPKSECHYSGYSKHIAYYRRDSKNGGITVHIDGSEFTWNDFDNEHMKTEVTEAEALARVTPAEVWPQYWTAINDITFAYCLRYAADKYCMIKRDGSRGPENTWYHVTSEGRTQLTKEQAEALLPPLLSPKRVPVRLWTHRNALRGSSCRVIAQSRPIDDCNIEIHSDGNGGWYVEEQP